VPGEPVDPVEVVEAADLARLGRLMGAAEPEAVDVGEQPGVRAVVTVPSEDRIHRKGAAPTRSASTSSPTCSASVMNSASVSGIGPEAAFRKTSSRANSLIEVVIHVKGRQGMCRRFTGEVCLGSHKC